MKQKKTVEDYLKTIYILQCRNGIVRGSDIAQEQNVSRPTVSIALKDLEQEGYLFTDEAHEIHLTKIGQKIAEATYERHQTLQNLLIKLGVDQQTAAADACKMEHAVGLYFAWVRMHWNYSSYFTYSTVFFGNRILFCKQLTKIT